MFGRVTQIANEALHQLVWKFCPNFFFLGASAVKCGAALAICHFKEGVSSFYPLAKSFGCELTSAAMIILVGRDRRRIARSVYKESETAKCLCKLC